MEIQLLSMNAFQYIAFLSSLQFTLHVAVQYA